MRSIGSYKRWSWNRFPGWSEGKSEKKSKAKHVISSRSSVGRDDLRRTVRLSGVVDLELGSIRFDLLFFVLMFDSPHLSQPSPHGLFRLGRRHPAGDASGEKRADTTKPEDPGHSVGLLLVAPSTAERVVGAAAWGRGGVRGCDRFEYEGRDDGDLQRETEEQRESERRKTEKADRRSY